MKIVHLRQGGRGMMAFVMDSPETNHAHIPDYDGGPFAHKPELLRERLFWLAHLHEYFAQSEESEQLIAGTDMQQAGDLQTALFRGTTWPLFTEPFSSLGGRSLVTA